MPRHLETERRRPEQYPLDISPETREQIQRFKGLPSRPKIGLALAGGGARGLAHVGVLLALEALGLPLDYIAGTSAGSIAGAAAAARIPLDRLLEIAFDTNWLFMLQPGGWRRRGGVLSSAGIERWVLGWLGDLTFEQLTIPLTAMATDLRTGEAVSLREGSVARAVRISSTVPGLYTPVVDEGRILADGGLVCNVPVSVVREMGADIVIAVDLNCRLSTGPLESFSEVVSQSILLLQRANERREIAQADFVIEPDLSQHTLVNFEGAEALIWAGFLGVAHRVSELADLLGGFLQ